MSRYLTNADGASLSTIAHSARMAPEPRSTLHWSRLIKTETGAPKSWSRRPF